MNYQYVLPILNKKDTVCDFEGKYRSNSVPYRTESFLPSPDYPLGLPSGLFPADHQNYVAKGGKYRDILIHRAYFVSNVE